MKIQPKTSKINAIPTITIKMLASGGSLRRPLKAGVGALLGLICTVIVSTLASCATYRFGVE